jgi:hypothetical protein
MPRRPSERPKVHLRAALLALVCLAAPRVVAQIQLESDLSLDLSVEPGESHAGTLILRNLGVEAGQVRLYLSDYRFDADGQTYYEEAGSSARSNSSWINLPAPSVVIPAGQVVTLGYEIEVPNDPYLVGSYWSLLMVEQTADRPGLGTEEPAFALRQLVRYGVQVVTTLRETGETRLRFSNPGFERGPGGERFFVVDVENSGERFVRPSYRLELYDLAGARLGRFDSPPRRLYPGTGAVAGFDLSELAPGSYNAILIADAGGEHVFGARYTLEIDPR